MLEKKTRETLKKQGSRSLKIAVRRFFLHYDGVDARLIESSDWGSVRRKSISTRQDKYQIESSSPSLDLPVSAEAPKSFEKEGKTHKKARKSSQVWGSGSGGWRGAVFL